MKRHQLPGFCAQHGYVADIWRHLKEHIMDNRRQEPHTNNGNGQGNLFCTTNARTGKD